MESFFEETLKICFFWQRNSFEVALFFGRETLLKFYFIFLGKTEISLKPRNTKSRANYTHASARSWYKIQGGGIERKTREFRLFDYPLPVRTVILLDSSQMCKYKLPQQVGVVFKRLESVVFLALTISCVGGAFGGKIIMYSHRQVCQQSQSVSI